MNLSTSAIQEGIADPKKAFQHLSSLVAKVHSSLISSQYQQQSIKLAKLRTKDNFCLIVLDACRYDFLKGSFDKYFYGSCEPMWATSLNTFEYLRYLWPETYDYPYVTAAAPVTSQQFNFQDGEEIDGLANDGAELLERYCGYIPNNHFMNLVEVWRESWDEDLGVCPPEPVTKTSIDLSSKAGTNRIVTHYFQPHGPFIGENRKTGSIEGYDSDVEGGAVEKGIWSAVKNGEISKKKLRSMYQSNLDRALAAVAELIRQTDYEKYIIMGDHGEALGEYGQYYHSIEHPKVRVVPWATVEGVRDDAPNMWNYQAQHDAVNKTTESRLQELGYIE